MPTPRERLTDLLDDISWILTKDRPWLVFFLLYGVIIIMAAIGGSK